ncbi:hypothetical protein AB1N83_013397, partial [Pleurotus pulmonarius]
LARRHSACGLDTVSDKASAPQHAEFGLLARSSCIPFCIRRSWHPEVRFNRCTQ